MGDVTRTEARFDGPIRRPADRDRRRQTRVCSGESAKEKPSGGKRMPETPRPTLHRKWLLESLGHALVVGK
jgi:hypothetical protein